MRRMILAQIVAVMLLLGVLVTPGAGSAVARGTACRRDRSRVRSSGRGSRHSVRNGERRDERDDQSRSRRGDDRVHRCRGARVRPSSARRRCA